jgi:nitric oxide reductase activation protein
LRHAGAELARESAYRRLLLVVSDGEPSDLDVGGRRYLAEDARQAVQDLARRGIDVFCVGLEAGGGTDFAHIFGRRRVFQIDRIESLPAKLPLVYLRLTA